MLNVNVFIYSYQCTLAPSYFTSSSREYNLFVIKSLLENQINVYFEMFGN